jgi:hypothetical protein
MPNLDGVTLQLIENIFIHHLTPLVDHSDSISYGRLNQPLKSTGITSPNERQHGRNFGPYSFTAASTWANLQNEDYIRKE